MLVAATWRHAGYIMVLYLAGLKSVDPALREAAAIDGANQCRRSSRSCSRSMRPINIIVVVITFISALRAFDIVYIVNQGRNGLEIIGALVTQNIVGEDRDRSRLCPGYHPAGDFLGAYRLLSFPCFRGKPI